MSRFTVTGATGLIGRRLVERLTERGDEVTVLSRSPEKAAEDLGVQAVGWDASSEAAPAAALEGRDGVVHLAGAPIAQRWTESSKNEILKSREDGTRNLVAGLQAAGDARPGVLVSASGVGYYGDAGDAVLDETSPPGDDFPASVCVVWEREADAAAALGVRVVKLRTGIVLDGDGGALEKMLLPFKAGVGGPVAGGRQYMAWISLDDIVGMYLAALDDPAWDGVYNGTGPEPVTNKIFSKALGKALHRPAFAPVPAFALKVLYGEMSELVLGGQRAVPKRAAEQGFKYEHPTLEAALAAAL